MEKAPKKLILCIDIDNDLYEKVKTEGPLIGRKANLEAAIKLALCDPEEVDANVIFYGVKLYDELSDNEDVELVTLTGDKRLGVIAHRKIAEQLEKVLIHYKARSCIFVSDGASDEEILPIIRSRIQIDATKIVVMKQAKELEKTYFVILEKLKDPTYSWILLGIPAMVLLLYSLASVIELRLEYVGILLSLYLLIKVSGIEMKIISLFSSFSFSPSKISTIIPVVSFVVLIMSIGIAYDTYSQTASIGNAVYTFWSLVIIPMLGLFLAKMLDSFEERNKLEIVRYGKYAIEFIVVWSIVATGILWILNERYISQFITTFFYMLLFGIIGNYLINMLRWEIISKMKLENKEVISLYGGYIGKIKGIDKKSNMLIVQSHLGDILEIKMSQIVNISDIRVYVNY